MKNYVMLMDTMFEKAIRLRYIKRGFNPVKEVDLPKIQKNEIEAYTEEELKTLLRLMDECEDKILSACIKIIVGTGIRRGEVCGLRIENFSSERKEIKITEAIVYAENKNISKTPKSSAGRRSISLPDSVVEVIEERIREYKLNKLKLGKKFHDEGYIICHEDGSIFSPTVLYNRYKKFMQKHSDELRYLSLHKLRHTFDDF
ncbi:MAG: tyrosine-type recombinase/integrase [Lachnospiraceae bacterium]|nr:tyrosine-type recombinase/integrase [Lachnospiraceae bacterium]MCI9138090.1 tyrosine-type recombinase/integrase [Lachnospiraceae bacterium]